MADKKHYIKLERAEDLENHLECIMQDCETLKQFLDAYNMYEVMGGWKAVCMETLSITERYFKHLQDSLTKFYLKFKTECNNTIMK